MVETDVKFLELRDKKGTFIVAMALQITNSDWFLWSAGLSTPLVYLIALSQQRAAYDAYHWQDRTMHTAHRHLEDHWSEIPDGAVIDVEFLLGERPSPQTSARITN
jgi:hypothetical protein